jgi:hypothetical protein
MTMRDAAAREGRHGLDISARRLPVGRAVMGWLFSRFAPPRTVTLLSPGSITIGPRGNLRRRSAYRHSEETSMTDIAEPPARYVSDAHTAMPSLQGRRAIITGGTTGIGRAIAVLLASEGADVFICGRDPQHLEDGLARIREVGRGDGINLDLAEPDGVDRFVMAAKTISAISTLPSSTPRFPPRALPR